MRQLMLSTALVLPLVMGPAMAQDTATTPAPADPATDTTTMGTEAAPAAEVPASENTEEAADAADAADQAAVAASGKVEQQQAENELRIDWITDATVNSPDGNAIGEINDVIVDAEAGTMKAAVIGVGGFLGIGEKQIAVPWDQLTINYDAQQITSDLTQEEAEAAPEYVFREQEQAPDAAGATGADNSGMTAGGTAAEGTMTTAPMPGAPVATPDSAASTTTAPAASTDAAATGAPAPADTAETPATPPMGSDAAAPAADGTTTPPAN
ncbi:PRC-barrel domain-containing protein [Paracoccus shandongensis]|uniref:PRC-barrel domain-containing protein n=1 Tax=Paracoccus shandongensis TaxID=2816048 RepID=UPI001A8DFE8F|nr:PRC-barrel domain-containing protein [Paracoccus shandongensis]